MVIICMFNWWVQLDSCHSEDIDTALAG